MEKLCECLCPWPVCSHEALNESRDYNKYHNEVTLQMLVPRASVQSRSKRLQLKDTMGEGVS
eukprot:1160872-Pelagomonas_calceolata.AAC.5